MRSEHEIDRFRAVSDDGEEFTVIRYQSVTEHRPLSGPPARVKGTRRLALSNRRHVNEIDPETFQVVETDQIIRKVA